MVTYWAPGGKGGIDPFKHGLDQSGHLTHGHLQQTRHHGGTLTALAAAKPQSWPKCSSAGVAIKQFQYKPGDLARRAARTGARRPSRRAASITFTNQDASTVGPGNLLGNPSTDYLNSIFHTVTSCKWPCGRPYGDLLPAGQRHRQLHLGPAQRRIPASGSIFLEHAGTSSRAPTRTSAGSHPFMPFRVVRRYRLTDRFRLTSSLPAATSWRPGTGSGPPCRRRRDRRATTARPRCTTASSPNRLYNRLVWKTDPGDYVAFAREAAADGDGWLLDVAGGLAVFTADIYRDRRAAGRSWPTCGLGCSRGPGPAWAMPRT